MKKILCLIITATLLLTSTSIAFAKSHDEGKQNEHQKQNTQHQDSQHQNHRLESTKQSFKINGSPVIKCGRHKLPISPITKGMGATVTFDKATAILTVVKSATTIVIDFKNKTVTVNGVADTNSGIFTAKNNKKTTVLIKYIANVLGVRVNCDNDKVTVEVPGLDLPTNVIVTSAGTTVVANTLNNTTLYMNATASIIAGQATGGKAELYVGSKLVAIDADITATDTAVTFTTADSTPTNLELQAAVPAGGVVTVRLYNASNKYVTSTKANPTLAVDYVAPTITGITSAVYSVTGSAIYINVTGASLVGDKVDVTKISFYDTTLGRTYQLTNSFGIGSNGVVNSPNLLVINIGAVDKLGLAGFGNTNMFLIVAPGSLLTDSAGNTSSGSAVKQTVPVTVTN